MKKVAIYTRVSSRMQVEKGNSIPSQKEALTKYAEMMSWEVFDYYTDEGISGRRSDRPEFQRLLTDAKSKEFDVILIYKISRLARSVIDLTSTVKLLIQLDISLVSYSENFDLGTAAGKLTFNILSSIAEFDSETIGENISFGKMGAALRGKRTFPKLLGYKIDKRNNFVLDREKSMIVKELFQLYETEKSMLAVKNIVNSRGYRTLRDKPFLVSGLAVILSNISYVGYVKYNNEIVFKAKVIPQIISEKQFDSVQEILRSNSLKFGKSAKYIKTVDEWLNL